MSKPDIQLQADVDAIQSISLVPTILDVVCRTTGMGFAAIARVTENNWMACGVKDDIAFGLQPGGELQLETTICHEIRQSGNPVVIDHVIKNDIFKDHHTPALYGFQSYISVPIVKRDGTFFGTLCAIDPHPRKLESPEVIGMFTLFADLISLHLDNYEKVQNAEAELQKEKRTASLREEFIAILGHDLRNPVGAISSSTQLMQMLPMDETMKKVVTLIQNSTYRITGLIDNMLDFARGRLGEGITLSKGLHGLKDNLLQVISESQTVWPERKIDIDIDLPDPVYCDTDRIAQLFSNVLSNAMTYGDPEKAVRVKAGSDDSQLTLSVTNEGKIIPEPMLERLFKPYARGNSKDGHKGLGLGLYIASEIAHAHKGTLTVDSTDVETTFTLTIPCK